LVNVVDQKAPEIDYKYIFILCIIDVLYVRLLFEFDCVAPAGAKDPQETHTSKSFV